MSIEAQADSLNQDGSITIMIDGKGVKFVKDSDLGAVKSALTAKETEVSKLQTDLANTNTKFDTEHQFLLQERTAKEQFEKGANESEAHKTKVGELETKMADLSKASVETEASLAERIRITLVQGYKVDAEKIKDMALPELVSTEKTLQLTGVAPAPANYDGAGPGGGGPSGSLEGKTPFQLAAMHYETKK